MLFNIKIKEPKKEDTIVLNNISFKITESVIPEEPMEIYGFNVLLNNYRNKLIFF